MKKKIKVHMQNNGAKMNLDIEGKSCVDEALEIMQKFDEETIYRVKENKEIEDD